MAEVPMGNIIEVKLPDTPGLAGNRNTATLQKAFSNSPIYQGPPYVGSDKAVRTNFENLVLKGEVSNGFGFSSYIRDFKGAPNIPDVKKDNDDKAIASPYAPNIASPNEDGIQEEIVNPVKGAGSPFQGNALENPATSSEKIGRLTLGSFGLGTSDPQGNSGS